MQLSKCLAVRPFKVIELIGQNRTDPCLRLPERVTDRFLSESGSDKLANHFFKLFHLHIIRILFMKVNSNQISVDIY